MIGLLILITAPAVLFGCCWVRALYGHWPWYQPLASALWEPDEARQVEKLNQIMRDDHARRQRGAR